MELLAFPFMQRALVAGIILAALLASLGIFVSLRRMAFFGDGIAHSSLAGIAIALLVGAAPLPASLIWAVGVAILVYWLERRTHLPSDTLIGILFTSSMALGIVLMGLRHGYRPDLLSYLFGSILTVSALDLAVTALVASVVIVWLGVSMRQLAYLSLAEESAAASGVPAALQTLALYVALALATVLGVKMLGVILVPSLLVLPPAIGRMLTTSFRGYVIATIVAAEIMTVSGLTIAAAYDLAPGASVVLAGTVLFALSFAARIVRR